MTIFIYYITQIQVATFDYHIVLRYTLHDKGTILVLVLCAVSKIVGNQVQEVFVSKFLFKINEVIILY